MTFLDELIQRAKQGDSGAAQQLRERGYFRRQRERKTGYELSSAQRRIWVLEQMDGEAGAYNMPVALQLEGRIDASALRQGVTSLVDRHESLRTIIAAVDDNPRQFVRDRAEIPWQVMDLSREPDPLHAAGRLAREHASGVFDLAQGPLLSTCLLKLAEDRWVFLLNVHHVVCDQWSLQVMGRELMAIYDAIVQGRDARLPPLRIQYKDYAAWQNLELAAPEFQLHRDYWRQKLGGELPTLEFPLDFPRPANKSFAGNTVSMDMPPELSDALQRLGSWHGSSLFMTLTALVKVLLFRYTGAEDILVGTPYGGRDQADLQSQVGCFVNTLVLRDQIQGTDPFSVFLERVTTTTLEAIEHHAYPFDRLLDDLQAPRDLSRTPLFDVLVLLEQQSGVELQLGDVRVAPFDSAYQVAKFDLSFEFAETAAGIQLGLNYDADLYREATVRRMMRHFEQLAASAVADPNRPIGELELLAPHEKQKLAFEFNDTSADYPHEKTIVDLFQEQAAAVPDNPAVIFGDGELSYRELNCLSNDLAQRLIDQHGVRTGELIAVCLDRNEQVVIALLGILKAGAAYVPLDLEYPDARLRHMLADSHCRLILTEPTHREQVVRCLPKGEPPEIVELSRAAAPAGAADPPSRAVPDDPAYVIYTSGSTGPPKGCVVTHRNVVRLMKNSSHPFDFGAGDVWVVAHSFCFDFSVWEMYGALLYGGRVVIAPRDDVRDVRAFRDLLRRHRVTVLNQTPAAFYNLIEAEAAADQHDLSDHLHYVIFGGDRLDPGRLKGWIEHYPAERVRLINMYGITETTVHVTFGPIDADAVRQANGTSPIGRPLPETTVYVCNEQMHLQPIGVVGEMYVGGTGVSRGYLNREDLNAEHFVKSPFRKGEILYRSGDLGKWTADGTLEHWGRNDSQVQIRGFRVELSEVERAVLEHPEIRDAAVVAVVGESGVLELAAYVVERSPVDVAELRARVAQQLPDYMAPHYFVRLPELPLTPNGKLQRKALPYPRHAAAGLEDAIPPRTPRELQLAELWRRLLGLEFVGANSNFFAIGGDSLKALRVVNGVAREMAMQIGIKDVFRFPTIAELAQWIDREQTGGEGERENQDGTSQSPEDDSGATPRAGEATRPASVLFVRSDPRSSVPMSSAQRRLWFLDQAAPASPLYNVFRIVRMKGPLDVDALQASLNKIIQRHEVLRTTFSAVDGKPHPVVHDDFDFRITVDDLQPRSSPDGDFDLQRRCAEETRAPFDLETGPLVRCRLLRSGPRDHVAVLSLHHIVCDGWSINVLIDELARLYPAYSMGRPAPLSELPIQYGDFARWQEEWLASEVAVRQREWWESQLAGWSPLELPTDQPRSAEPSFRGAAHVFSIGPEHLAALRTLAREENATLYMTLLALFFVLLHRYSDQQDIVVGTPVANRGRAEMETLIGFFVNTLVMRCDLSGRPCLRSVLRQVRDFALEAYANQDFPFDELVKVVAPDRGAAGNPLFQAMFSMESETAAELELAGMTLTPIDVDSQLAKFDLLLNFTETAEGVVGAFEYSTDLFGEDTIRRMAAHFVQLLESGAALPNQEVGTLPLLSTGERDQMLVEWNDTDCSFPAEEPVHRLFEAQADRTPDAVALEFGPRVSTYRQLDELANGIARRLRSAGVRDQMPVALFVRRSTEMVVGMLGILKAGGYYVPLDTDCPRPRLALMLEDCQAPVVLTQREVADDLPDTVAQVLMLDEEASVKDESRDVEPVRLEQGGDRLAYVIYTSGSTGQPKGVAVPHRAIVRLVRNTNYIEIQPDDVVAQASNAAFDAATFEIWGALLNGAKLAGVERELTLSPSDFAQFLRGQRITTLFLTTALFNQMARDVPHGFATLRHVLFGGELVDPHCVREVLRHGRPQRLLHVYGPTENTTFSTWHLVQAVRSGTATVPIGRAISNTQLYVLDRRLQPVPIGVPGELYVGGAGLARGYLNRPDLTGERFVECPFQEGCRLYKTGDMVRWLPSGDLEFIGRRDHQVKIRGFRIELGEIEAWLSRHSRVRDAVVLAREDRPGHRELVAYLVVRDAAGGASQSSAQRQLATVTTSTLLMNSAEYWSLLESQLRSDMAQDLPGYMTPARFVFLDNLPLNANGKVDRRVLPAPGEACRQDRALEPPQDDVEQTVVDIWRGVLDGRELGVNDNYFHLGGDSISAIQLISRLKQVGWDVSVRDLFEHPTVRSLAPILRRLETRSEASQDSVTGSVPLTPIQRWFFDEHAGDLHHFNQAVLLRSYERIDATALELVLCRLWEHHDALRMTYSLGGAEVLQSMGGSSGSPGFEIVDLRDEQDEAAALQAYADRVQGGFNLEHGPLFKAVLFRLQQSDRLLLVIHHLAVDGVSWRILLEDLQRGYGQCLRGETVEFDPKTDSFQRWAQQLLRYAGGEAVLADQAYWSSVLSRDAPAFPRDTDEAGPNLYGDSETVHTSLSPDETSLLLTQTHQAYDTEVNDLLLTALGRALQSRHGNRRALITLEGHGREPLDVELDLSRTIGWFTCCYPFLLPAGEGNLGDQIRAVRRALRGVPHRGLSFGILRYLTSAQLAPAVGGVSAPQLSFNYLGRFDGGDDSTFGFAPESCGRAISPQLTRLHDLDVIGIVTVGRLSLSITYHPLRHRRESVQQLLDNFREQLLLVAEHCRVQQRESASRKLTFSHLPADDFNRILQNLSDEP